MILRIDELLNVRVGVDVAFTGAEIRAGSSQPQQRIFGDAAESSEPVKGRERRLADAKSLVVRPQELEKALVCIWDETDLLDGIYR